VRSASLPPRAGPGAPRARVGARGLALVEVTAATAVVTVAVVGLLGAMSASHLQAQLATDTSIAADAARKQASVMASKSFRQIFALYNAPTSDDPGGAGTGFGPNFAVPGLKARPGDTDGLPGKIVFPAGGSSGEQVREDASGVADLGLPRDLDGDGNVDDKNKAASYVLLPAKIVIEWQGANGPGAYVLYVLFADRGGG